MNNFIDYKADEKNPKWENFIHREQPIYKRDNDLRSDFQRDYNRVIHSDAYKRMKHKTQVFFSPTSDHICTRIEHVNHVESISYSIAKILGLNIELTKAIATAHDIGHSPFGHQGERILSEISKRDIGVPFWHEKNGVNIADNYELLENYNSDLENLNLTYAVRDGIISHCGEVDENAIKPREEYIDLTQYQYPNQFAPYTWEACVVKVSDKISYIMRDIEDAISLHLIDNHLNELYDLLQYDKSKKINNSNIINTFVCDICQNSTPEKGLCFTEENLRLLNSIKQFNYQHIYMHKHLTYSHDYFRLIIYKIYDVLAECYAGENTIQNLEHLQVYFPNLISEFTKWIQKYWNLTNRSGTNLKNKVVVDMSKEEDYKKAILSYISGMTDNFAISCYTEIIGF